MDMDRVLATLAPREAEILRARYGLDDNKLKTLEEVGTLFNVRTTSAYPSENAEKQCSFWPCTPIRCLGGA